MLVLSSLVLAFSSCTITASSLFFCFFCFCFFLWRERFPSYVENSPTLIPQWEKSSVDCLFSFRYTRAHMHTHAHTHAALCHQGNDSISRPWKRRVFSCMKMSSMGDLPCGSKRCPSLNLWLSLNHWLTVYMKTATDRLPSVFGMG